MATVVEDWPTFTYTPTDEELAWERQYWELQARIAEYDAYVAARVAEQDAEHTDDEDDDFREEW